ncbi:MAG: putative toxin-antitoxin system toxin component, PIN family [Candidatus Rokuibacteriota bacterium]
MPTIVLDSSVLVSAFLTANGATDAVIQRARDGSVLVYASDAILDETHKVLAYPRLVQQYRYTPQDVQAFCDRVRAAVLLISPLPPFPAICRDPNDDMVLACALAATVEYLVTRDKDLLVLQQYEGIAIVTPEAFLAVLRANPH